jgi:hypothetical protein
MVVLGSSGGRARPYFQGRPGGEEGLVNAKLRVGGVYWPGTCIYLGPVFN